MMVRLFDRNSGAGRTGLILFLALTTSTFAVAAQAQTAPEKPSEPQGEQANSDWDIVVTARKQSERVSDVPIAIQAMSSEQIERYATTTFSSLATQVPGLSIGNSSSPNSAVVNLRGIGSGTSSATLDQAVSVNLDGLQVSQGNLLRLGFHDLERIEVLKGPQALFYGKNSPGGVISLVSANPGREFEASLRTGYEAYAGQKFVEAMVSAPLADGLGIRIVGYAADQSGWFRNVAPNSSHKKLGDRRDYFFRGTLRYESGSFDNTLKVSYAQSDNHSGQANSAQMFACPLGRPFFETAIPALPCKLDRFTVDSDSSAAAQAANPLIKGPTKGAQRQVAVIDSANLQVGDALSLASVTTYYYGTDLYNNNVSWTTLTLIPAYDKNRTRQFTQEVRATSSYDGPVNFMAGGFYQRNKFRDHGLVLLDMGAAFFQVPNGIPITYYHQITDLDTEAYSVFGQVTFQVASKVDFNIGGRYSHEVKKISATAVDAGLVDAVTGPITYPKPRSSYDNFSPEMTLRYKPTEDLMLYGTYRHGFVSGGYVTGPDRAPYNQSNVKGGEVGAKGLLLDRQLKFDVAAYSYKYNGLQLSAFDGATLAYKITNATGGKSYGVDLAMEFRPQAVPGLSLRGSLAWNHARYGDFRTAACYTGQTPAQGCNLNPVVNPFTGISAFQSQDLSGRRLLRAADWFGNIGATYESEISGGKTLSLSADAAYKSSYQPMLEMDPRANQKSSWLFNASIALRASNNAWEAALIGKNLTNVLRVSEANAAGLTGSGTGTSSGFLGDLVGQPNEPRAVMFQLTLRNSLFQ
ncbi:TonB-dependent receptor [Aquisediminimonas profunda]|uniref:TonB-dependent receptor n=1 Tax=Aquisediminimonas profunda TaxID=1550733 RepID=UPI001C62F9D1|nr:TonB-dependent receptor [Aquisediminimonas profunda]